MPRICVGLDFPRGTDLRQYLDVVRNVPADLFKLNPAFMRSDVLHAVVSEINIKGTKWIYDGKLGDVTHTNEQYAKYVFEELGAYGVTLNPFVGLDALYPFLNYKDKVSFILAKTTNDGVKKSQDIMFRDIINFASYRDNVGIVYSSKDAYGLQQIAEEGFPILSPGVGHQGGEVLANNENIIYTISRSVILSPKPRDTYLHIKGGIDQVFLEGLKSRGMIKQGTYTLSSGLTSDFYVNLRELSSDISFYKEVCSSIANEIRSPAILGVESGSISLASTLGVLTSKPFGYIRKVKKSHGESKIVEGIPPMEAAIIDDVLTTGSSLEKAIVNARSKGYTINQVLTIVERTESEGRLLLEKYGVEVISLIRI